MDILSIFSWNKAVAIFFEKDCIFIRYKVWRYNKDRYSIKLFLKENIQSKALLIFTILTGLIKIKIEYFSR